MKISRKLKKALKCAFLKTHKQYGWRSKDYTIKDISNEKRFTLRDRIVKAKGYAVISDSLGRK